MPRIQEVELTQSVSTASYRPIPVLRCHIVEAGEYQTDSMLQACTSVTFLFEEYRNPEQPDSETDEVLTVSCMGRKEDVGMLVKQDVCLKFNILLPKVLGGQFREQVKISGLWWFLVRFDDSDRFISFTVDPRGTILGRHLISLEGDIMASIHDGTVH